MRKKTLLYLSTAVILFVLLNVLIGFEQIVSLIYLQDIRLLTEKYLFESFILFLILNTFYIFFLGFGSISIIISIILFKPILALLLNVISKTIGSTLNIAFLQKNIFKKDIVFFDKKSFLKILKKFQFLYVFVLRIIPGIPLQAVNAFIGFMKTNSKTQIIASIAGFTFSNGIFIFLLNNIYEAIFKLRRGSDSIEIHNIIFIFVFVIILIFYNQISKKINYKKNS